MESIFLSAVEYVIDLHIQHILHPIVRREF